MNESFVNVTGSLGINEKFYYESATEEVPDPVHNVLHKFSNSPKISKIKNYYQHNCSFHFKRVNLDGIDLEIIALTSKTSIAYKGISSKILKTASDICLKLLT